MRSRLIVENITIVQDDRLAGDPRLGGRRISVLHVVTAVEDFGSVDRAADELRIPEEDVREALKYAEEHPEE
ncbi:DUF433 domain-containing protein [Halomontanus rarus]|uniref:DUF433 domain-containing protein n=1 Tax=Halomontanus rarus TaxID=3034020 RepID=UPI001A9877D8